MENKVFVVQHLRESSEDEDVKFIGVYSSEEQARKAIESLKNFPGFIDYQDGFYVDKYEIDKTHWVEGFGISDDYLDS
ncbi:homoserine kinase type II [Verrucomicrobium sp. GAS474]|uniref:DUF7336 domain-containing protein n=1 Tax=Verrucomicrobium sp. GAS474 TaxID=1882831 RepID=UPI00087B5497|nr:hypothetical protein [Verrucomicrobium sp. GAS474]SDT87561.1 homoserine kinase type II [Verrucomicrobium sp. GAS474]